MPLSPAAAAKIAGVSRSLISREIKCGALPATLKNNGHHAVERADLDAWMSRRTERAEAPEPPTSPEPAPDHAAKIDALTSELIAAKEALARLEGRAEADAARIADLSKDRDAWKSQAESLASNLRPVSLWTRLFGS